MDLHGIFLRFHVASPDSVWMFLEDQGSWFFWEGFSMIQLFVMCLFAQLTSGDDLLHNARVHNASQNQNQGVFLPGGFPP